MTWAYVLPIVLLFCSNVFMTFAWYGQLRFPGVALWIVIPVSWGIAFFEYCLAVPANRIGYAVYSGAQLKVIQEIITISVFAVFAVLYLGELIRWNHMAAFGCLILGGLFYVPRMVVAAAIHSFRALENALDRGSVPLALHALAQQFAVAADRLGLFAGAALRGFLVIAPQFHFPEHPFALHLLLQGSESLIDVVVANEDLHGY